MGACIGKKSSKYLNRNSSRSDLALAPQIKEQTDGVVTTKSSPSAGSKKIVVTVDDADGDEDPQRISRIEDINIDSELRTILEEQKRIHQAFCQPFPSRVVSTTDTELEFELAKLMLEYSDNDFDKIPPTPTVNNETDV